MSSKTASWKVEQVIPQDNISYTAVIVSVLFSRKLDCERKKNKKYIFFEIARKWELWQEGLILIILNADVLSHYISHLSVYENMGREEQLQFPLTSQLYIFFHSWLLIFRLT